MQHPPRDSGFTLIEVLVTISLLCIIMAFAVTSWSSWARSSAQSGTAREIQSAMRQAQQRAVTEGRATCVLFDTSASAYSTYRGACSDSAKVLLNGPVKTASPHVLIADPSFTTSAGTSAGATFQGRGTGSLGTVKITRTDSTKVYTLSVDWLTGRVSLS